MVSNLVSFMMSDELEQQLTLGLGQLQTSQKKILFRVAIENNFGWLVDILKKDSCIDPGECYKEINIFTSSSDYIDIDSLKIWDVIYSRSQSDIFSLLLRNQIKLWNTRLVSLDPIPHTLVLKAAVKYDLFHITKLLLTDFGVIASAPIKNANDKIQKLLLQHGAQPENKNQEKYQKEWIKDQAIVLNQLPYGPYGRLPALITCTILSFAYNIEIKELYDDMAQIKRSIDML